MEINSCFQMIPDDIVWSCILTQLNIENLEKLLGECIKKNDTKFAYNLVMYSITVKNYRLVLNEYDIRPFIVYAMQHFKFDELIRFLNNTNFPMLCSCTFSDSYWDALFKRSDISEINLNKDIIQGCCQCRDSAICYTILSNNIEQFKHLNGGSGITVKHVLKAIIEAARSNNHIIDIAIDIIKKNDLIKKELCFNLEMYSNAIFNSSLHNHDLYDSPSDEVYNLMLDIYDLLKSNTVRSRSCSNKYLKKIQRILQNDSFNLKAIVNEYGYMHSNYYEYWYNYDAYDEQYFTD